MRRRDRDTFYPSGTAPQVDGNGELDPGDPSVPGGNAKFIYRFSRVGASFDPTSPLTTGSFLLVMQILSLIHIYLRKETPSEV